MPKSRNFCKALLFPIYHGKLSSVLSSRISFKPEEALTKTVIIMTFLKVDLYIQMK